ncbi:hypothetical protein ACTL6P_23505 [Endozoicomonas acroporae]|uniref:hypothetical protein n=1 Tax=Endozoicomonas TaxID=305899 RepID=UPI0011AEEBCB|nr:MULTISPECIES: hypothetical protein [Endozoicomonas]WBA81719.1 hypothetical protein O2T12_00640 [Endozoicomonas sp. GU-1]WBA84675.1 hypothetical protein O3276_15450 [Endozoicomonas sp. GU-1]
MSQLYDVSQENNPIYIQAELADAALKAEQLREAREAADKHHFKLQLEETIDLDGNGDGRSHDSRLLNILARQSVIG